MRRGPPEGLTKRERTLFWAKVHVLEFLAARGEPVTTRELLDAVRSSGIVGAAALYALEGEGRVVYVSRGLGRPGRWRLAEPKP